MQHFTVYSKPNCPYCDQAKALLESKRLPFVVINLDVGQPKHEFENYISRDDLLKLIPTARTMPQIMQSEDDNQTLIGGYTELKMHLS